MWVNVNEIDVHDIFGLEFLRESRRFPFEEWDSFNGDVLVVNAFVEQVARPFGHHQRDHDRQAVAASRDKLGNSYNFCRIHRRYMLSLIVFVCLFFKYILVA